MNSVQPNLNFVNLAHLYPKIKRLRNELVKHREEGDQTAAKNNIENLIEHMNVESGVKLIYNGKPIHHLGSKSNKKDPKKLALTKAKFTAM